MMKGQEDKKQILIKLLCIKTVLSHCLKCKTSTENITPVVSKTKNVGTMTLSKCVICGTNKSRLIKKQEAKDY